MPNYLISQGNNRVVLRNYEGVITTYQEPKFYTPGCPNVSDEDPNLIGVAGLLNGQKIALEPEGLERHYRKKPSCN